MIQKRRLRPKLNREVSDIPSVHADLAVRRRLAEFLGGELDIARSLAEFGQAHVPEDVTVAREGRPFHVIARETAEQGCDLIVTATRGHTGLAHGLIGSTAERGVRQAACSVLVVR